MKNRLSFNLLFGLAAASVFAIPAFAQEAPAEAAVKEAAAETKGPEVKFSFVPLVLKKSSVVTVEAIDHIVIKFTTKAHFRECMRCGKHH